jgi:centrosomal CEP192-like protein
MKRYFRAYAIVFLLSGSAVFHAHAQLTVSPDPVNFSNQTIGTTSANQIITVTNAGTLAVTISAAGVSPTEFILTAGGAVTLQAGQQTTYKVEFAPDAAQTFNGALTLTIAGGHPVVVPLSGAGVPTLSVSPSSENFGTVPVGLTNGGVVIAVTNIGTQTIKISSLIATPSEFQLVEGTPIGLKPGTRVTYQVSFVPDSAQTFNGSLTITLANNTIPTVIPLTGTGMATSAVARVTPSSMSFPNVLRGTQSKPQTVTITNTGTSPLTVQTPYATPPFIVSPFKSVVLNGGQSTTMSVTMFGNSVGSYTGTLNIPYDVLLPSGASLTGKTISNSSLSITTFPMLPMGTRSSKYLATLQASGGSPPYTWNLVTGSVLPLGLTLSGRGTISGTLDPSVAANTYKFAVQAVDSSAPPKRATAQLLYSVKTATGSNCNDISFNVAGTKTPMVPLTDLGTGTYLGVEGGLYPNGRNVRPPDHDAAGVTLANSIQPLDVNGNPDPNGIYAFMSLGISDTQQEFTEFMKLANADPAKNPKLVVTDGAIFGATAGYWADPTNPYWTNLFTNILPTAKVSPNQIVAAWVQDINPGYSGTYPGDMVKTQADLESIAQNLHTFFPNLLLAYYSGRIYGGYGNGIQPYDPEPYAYESSLAVRGVIEDQLSGLPSLNWDPSQGPVMVPWLSWGPYYWANGLLARNDGLVWTCQDLKSDGLHPNDPLGRQKVATFLLNFLKTDDTTAPWYLAH